MGYIQMPNGAINYYNGAYSYSAEHGAVYNNQHEETELINSIIDQKLNEYSRQAEQNLEQSIKRAISEYGNMVWQRLLEQVMHALESDIVSEVKIGVSGCKDIFYGSQAQQFISDQILKATKAELSKIKGITSW